MAKRRRTDSSQVRTIRIPDAHFQNLPTSQIAAVLTQGEMELQGLLPWSSNYTFLALVTCDQVQLLCVYKPCKGERPLWDFPHGTLCKREYAAYVVSQALHWELV